ncbi:resolvase, N-terminal domain protein [Gleimia coleocanis DSM 15436]|uniref:Resolvase, N-terminal domain protein n=1 Tax=Gleimia coleocanis DSM 15436 TaxID=525245 RepID=C0VZG2_9ACTO|nr:recombinase family protein [Gleimia coleocanis]EEH64263.1 resolvase, N-terminal domain protein [Gleimia coleocanis DSM 15436]
MARKVTTIPATRTITGAPVTTLAKRRVAGYARVSTNDEDQANSYQAQIDYYTQYINGRTDWEMVDVYTDEGISGTSTARCQGFQRMIADALTGKIDLIVTKSVSRFARNTVDSLTTVRALKDKGVEVYFEKENIWTLDSKGELLITIMSSLAQEESRSISENVTWGKRKAFKDGKVHLPFSSVIGFCKGADGGIAIDPQTAPIVERIYREFIEGASPLQIAKGLTADGIPTPRGAKKWQTSTVRSILSNEKYKGDALLQKKFTADFLTKKLVKNEGQVPQYYVEGNHPAIIDPEVWEAAQHVAATTAITGRHDRTFSRMVFCEHCGGLYGAKTWHSTSKYKRVVWKCNDRYEVAHPGKTPTITDEKLQAAWLEAVADLVKRKSLIDWDELHAILAETNSVEVEILNLQGELEIITGLMTKASEDNKRIQQDQTEYLARFAQLEERYQHTVTKLDEAQALLARRQGVATELKQMRKALNGLKPGALVWDEPLFRIITEKFTITMDGSVKIEFKNGI